MTGRQQEEEQGGGGGGVMALNSAQLETIKDQSETQRRQFRKEKLLP